MDHRVARVDAGLIERLGGWIAENVPATSGPLRVEQLPGGSSNLTYRVRDDTNDWVLRRPPLGAALDTAHDVGREHRVQAALASTDVPVARMVAHCPDPGVIGAPFYLMTHVDGVVYADADAVAHLDESDAREATEELVDVLARLHAVDPHAVGLGDLGRPDGFLPRQLRRWRTQWERSSARSVPAVDEVARRLEASLPPGRPATLVHGDYSFNNTMWDRAEPARMVAVLDWEMATRGDPLTDVGMLVAYWGPVGALLWRSRSPQPHRANRGFPGPDVLADRYARASGRALEDLDVYVALATYKLAVITEGAAARLRATSPERAAGAEAMTEALAEEALATLRPGAGR